MKRLILLFSSAILFASLTNAQSFPPRGDRVNDLNEMLGLNKSQSIKVKMILKGSKEKADKLREEEIAVMEKLRDSTKTIFDKSQKDILKVLTKEQSEKFKEITAHQNMPGMPPSPLGMGDGNYPPDFVYNFPPPPLMQNQQMPQGMQPGNPSPDFNPPPPPCPDDVLLEELNEFDLFLTPDLPSNQQSDF